MRLAQTTDTRQLQQQRADPRQIMASEILAWTLIEAEVAIERELAENPALEMTEEAELIAPSPAFTDRATSRLTDSIAARGDGEDFDPFERVAFGGTLRDHLRAQVGQVADCEQAPIVRYLIECVDERGYLVADMNETAERLRVPPSLLEASILALQRMEPSGVGARDLQECLRLQCQNLRDADEMESALPLRIVNECWDELVRRNEARIAQRLQRTLAEVRQGLNFLQQRLTPYPAAGFRSDHSVGSSSAPAVRADIVFHRAPSGIVVEVARGYVDALRLAPQWERLTLARGSRIADDESLRRYARDQVERARNFLGGMARRGQTLQRMATYLAERQQGFIETGDRAFLRPLTRQTLAADLHLDESIVSRAVADKWAQIVTGEVVPLDAFFGTANAAREALVRLVAQENRARPYSDDEIVTLLNQQGFQVARRTVAKYRSQERILSTRMRRRVA